MAYKLKRIYICDHCGKCELPDIQLSPSGSYKVIPEGWEQLGKEDLCPECYDAYQKFRETRSDKIKIGF